MEGMCGQFYATPPYLQYDIYRKDEEKGVQRLKEKFRNFWVGHFCLEAVKEK